ncbi:hypothetical protein BJY52DRAFT_1221102 [Lactarius psammicola]|nr:hypothetical protein BJY52DRAFT_1221102 [Lactarius psammicola]
MVLDGVGNQPVYTVPGPRILGSGTFDRCTAIRTSIVSSNVSINTCFIRRDSVIDVIDGLPTGSQVSDIGQFWLVVAESPDHGFVSSSSLGAPTRADALRNSLTPDGISSPSHQFLNTAFTLFWREDQIGAQDGHVPGLNINLYNVRRKLMHLLQAVHTRQYAPQLPRTYALIYSLSAQEGLAICSARRVLIVAASLKEFLTDLSKEVFYNDRGLWFTKKNELYPVYPSHGSHAVMLRLIFGEALYEGILVDVAFAGFFPAEARRAEFPE